MSNSPRQFYLVININPQPWVRTRGAGKARFKSPRLRAYQDFIAQSVTLANVGGPITGPVSVGLSFERKRPKNRPAKVSKAMWATGDACPCAVVPDIDNYIKGVLDAVNKSNLWDDDAQVVSVSANKFYCGEGEEPRIVFNLRELE